MDGTPTLTRHPALPIWPYGWPTVALERPVAGALAGGRLAGRASPQRLSAAFTVLIVIVAGYTLARSLAAAA